MAEQKTYWLSKPTGSEPLTADQLHMVEHPEDYITEPFPREAPTIFPGIVPYAVLQWLWDQRISALPEEHEEILRQTLEGETREQDFEAFAAMLDYVETAIAADRIDIEEMTQEMYERREELFPVAVLQMEFVDPSRVSGSHMGRNPLLHTCHDMAAYIADIATTKEEYRISRTEIAVESFALQLHDFGKLFDPLDPTHGSGSVFWSEGWIEEFSRKLSEVDGQQDAELIAYKIRFLMRFHDVAGNIDLGFSTIEKSVNEMLDEGYFPSESLILALYRIQEADMEGTPGMPEKFQKVNRTIMRKLHEMIVKLKEEFGLDSRIIPTAETNFGNDRELVQNFFATAVRAEVGAQR